MKRNTIQRALILKAVRTLRCHPTADEVYAAVVAEHPTISRGTVYRNLKKLSEVGHIRNLEVAGCVGHFDHNCHDHHHVRCLSCGRIFDVETEDVPDLVKTVKDTHGYEFCGFDLTFKAICPECAGSFQQLRRQDAKKYP